VGALASFGDASGEKDVTFCPAVLTAAEIAANPFVIKSSFARFVAFYNDEFDSADIEVRQFNYNIVPVVKSYYILGGGLHSFTVRSNTKWAVKEYSVSDLNGILSPSYTPSLYDQPGGYNTAPGDKAYFELVDDKDQDGKTATLTLTDPDGFVADVNITIRAVACGLNGTAYTKDIGGSQLYMTHAYGTGDDQRCWMVENSKEGSIAEGTTSATSYEKRTDPQYAIGYYYTYAQASIPGNACPSGWRLFTNDEADVLVAAAKNAPNGIGKWWCLAANNAFAGIYYSSSGHWGHWQQYGEWWGAETLDVSNVDGLKTSYYLYRQYWFTVRCVQD
jgi:hypothetical protein